MNRTTIPRLSHNHLPRAQPSNTTNLAMRLPRALSLASLDAALAWRVSAAASAQAQPAPTYLWRHRLFPIESEAWNNEQLDFDRFLRDFVNHFSPFSTPGIYLGWLSFHSLWICKKCLYPPPFHHHQHPLRHHQFISLSLWKIDFLMSCYFGISQNFVSYELYLIFMKILIWRTILFLL